MNELASPFLLVCHVHLQKLASPGTALIKSIRLTPSHLPFHTASSHTHSPCAIATAFITRYTDLKSSSSYTLRLAEYPGGTRDGPFRIVTGTGDVLRDYAAAPKEMTVASYPVPASATASGSLTLTCEQVAGMAGSGHTCQISEAWLIEGSGGNN
jgi:hypothetical protein